MVLGVPILKHLRVKLFPQSQYFPRSDCILTGQLFYLEILLLDIDASTFALRKAKIVYNFDLSECNRVKLSKYANPVGCGKASA